MKKQELNAYLELIQALLDCSKGEEWNLLQQHEALITPQLLQVMDGVAQQFEAEGKANAATFLRQWGSQLAHLMQVAPQVETERPQEKTADYLNLIQALLECPKGSEPEILAQHPELLNPGLVQAVQQVSAQLAAKGNQDVALYLRHLAADISRMLQVAESYGLGTQVATPTPQAPVVPMLFARQPFATPSGESVTERKLASQDHDIFVAIAQSLVNLEAMISDRLPPLNPLWQLDILERAHQNEWILSSEQVEQLIGSTPQCPPGQNSFHQEGWIFAKVIPTGSHLGWRVSKETVDPSPVTSSKKAVTERISQAQSKLNH
jgi:hypothetical protein